MSRLEESESIDDESLSQCDVLVIKTPTEPFGSDEAAAIARFVGRGGGLLMIGDHTNCDRWSTHLNGVARPFGFQFRYDILFPVGSPYLESIRRRRFRTRSSSTSVRSTSPGPARSTRGPAWGAPSC